jgi:hypothetical protein
MNWTLSGPTSNALTSKLGHLRPQAYFIISLLSYSLISLFHHRHPRCTASLMAKACTPPFTAAEWFLSFPRGELWLPSTAGVASELHWAPLDAPQPSSSPAMASNAGRFDHHAVRATAPGPAATSCACGAPAPATEFSTPMRCGSQWLLWRDVLHRTQLPA